MTRYWFVGLNALVLLVMAFSPWAVPNRSFDGAGVLFTPFGIINPQGLSLPPINSAWVPLGFWLAVALLIASTVGLLLPNPQTRARLFYFLGGVGLALFVIEAIWFYQSVRAINDAALAQGVSARRLPLRRYALSLGTYLTLFYSIGLLLVARMQLPGGRAFMVRYRGVVVPLVSLLIAVLFGAAVVAFLKEGLGTQGKALGLATLISTKLDLVTYTYQLLFSPIITLPGVFQSLLLATPLIFTGLAVAFGFQAGLFNIGAPGQLTVGAIGAMLVGVYMPGPAWIVFPLAIAAAAAGGALWGAIPGWLKARFGANEVINTIMMNYIAASLFLFLISSNQYRFFGQTVRLPFKAEGFEAKSEEIQPGARIPLMIDLLVNNGHLSFAIPLAAIGAIVAYILLRRLDLGRRLLVAAGAMVVGFVIGGLVPGPAIQVSPALASVRFNGSFLIAILALLFYNYYLYRTSSGYEMRAFGLAPKAAEYAGVNLRRKVVVALAIAGALAGLAATHYVLGGGIDEYRLKQSLPASVGFTGIAVALMGQNTPLGISLSALLFGVLLTGGLQLNLQLGISRELVSILQALVVLLVAIGGFLPRYFTDPLRAAQVETEAKAEQEARDKALAGGR